MNNLTIFTEMHYVNAYRFDILAIEYIDDREIGIVTYGTHPCVYVQLTPDEIKKLESIAKAESCEPYDLVNCECHGGLSYYGNIFNSQDPKDMFIGWDYRHRDDYNVLTNTGHKWTVAEIIADIEKAIPTISI